MKVIDLPFLTHQPTKIDTPKAESDKTSEKIFTVSTALVDETTCLSFSAEMISKVTQSQLTE